MLKTLSTLISGAQARSEDRVRDAFALELIDQKIREAEAAQKAAKATLASLILRQRSEDRALHGLLNQISDLTNRAKSALAAGREDLAWQAADALATLENERTMRGETRDRLDQKVQRLRGSIEAGHRRIIDLRQGAIQARAVRREAAVQMRLQRDTGTSASDEAEALIARVLGQDDPFEQAEILGQINRDLDQTGITDRLAEAGFGPPPARPAPISSTN